MKFEKPDIIVENLYPQVRKAVRSIWESCERNDFTILEYHTDLDLEGFEDKDPETGEATGIKLPYIVTLEMGSREILSIRRNFQAEDPTKSKIDYFVHFKFLRVQKSRDCFRRNHNNLALHKICDDQ